MRVCEQELYQTKLYLHLTNSLPFEIYRAFVGWLVGQLVGLLVGWSVCLLVRNQSF